MKKETRRRILVITLVVTVLLGLLFVLVGLFNEENQQKKEGHLVGNYQLGSQYGLTGLDWDQHNVLTQAIEPGKTYLLPAHTVWANVINGDTVKSVFMTKTWLNMPKPGVASTPIVLAGPTTATTAQIVLGNLNQKLQEAMEDGTLGVLAPANQEDFLDGDSTINRATLIVVTKKQQKP